MFQKPFFIGFYEPFGLKRLNFYTQEWGAVLVLLIIRSSLLLYVFKVGRPSMETPAEREIPREGRPTDESGMYEHSDASSITPDLHGKNV